MKQMFIKMIDSDILHQNLVTDIKFEIPVAPIIYDKYSFENIINLNLLVN